MPATEFRSDPALYWRGNLCLAVAFGVAGALVLYWVGNPYPWVAPIAAVMAFGLRGLYLRSEALEQTWRLEGDGLKGPDGKAIPLSDISSVRTMWCDVQVMTRSGEKVLMKYVANPVGVIGKINQARATA